MSELNVTPEAAVVADLVKGLHNPQMVTLPDGSRVLITPAGLKVNSIKALMDEYRLEPERRKGTATLLSLQSFIDWTNRHKDDQSVVFADNNPEGPSLSSVINYNNAGEDTPHDGSAARFGDHRGLYRFPLSKAWKAWAAVDGRPMHQMAFAQFLEDRIGDVLVPPTSGAKEEDAKLLDLVGSFGGTLAGPSRLLELSRGLTIHENSKVKNAGNLSSGEVQIVFETNHVDGQGQPLNVPTAFLICIPVFEMGAAYRIPVRLRYQRADGQIKWSLVRYRPELFFDDAFNEAVDKAKVETGLQLFLGKQEAQGQ